jgi:(1->4)-alpha-D-glucan 1-alpha-D-glucosylmutase
MYLPVSTYRLQLHAGFPFAAATDLAPYLARLGVGACYTSPYFAAAPGSTHGYDVANHNAINPELGGPDAHARFLSRLAELGLGHMVDVVPNHMGVGTATNLWWRDVLENGPGSPGARFFDVDWAPVKAALQSKLLLPILGDQYGRVLERGELVLAVADGALVVRYFEHELPINPKLAPLVFRRAVGPLTAALGADSPHLHEFLSILTSLQNLPDLRQPRHADDDAPLVELVDERQREKEVARARLTRLVAECPPVGEAIETALREVNGEAGRPESFDALHELLEAQVYRLAYWRTASHEINYRRFFDVNQLAGLRVEDPGVFAATHALLGDLLASGFVHAVRVDHPDGLFDPATYFAMLQALGGGDLYVLAEKILSAGEALPRGWRVAGTTGYDYLNELNGVFVARAEAKRMRRAYVKLTGLGEAFGDVRYDCKRLIMETSMASELNVLAHALERIAEGNRRSRDFTLDSLRDALTEVIACFPVYRTYVDEHGWTPEDRAVVERAIARARRRNPAMEASLFDFFREVMLPRTPDVPGGANASLDSRAGDRRVGYPPADADEAAERLEFAMKFQQYTGPVQAKGLEDTAFFRYNLLLSLNEVGGDVERFGREAEDFHDANAERLRDRPFAMIATATHDTKLGEDARARLNVLSELPGDWSREVTRWMRINRAHRTLVDGEPAPDRNDEYRFYQALLAIWPVDALAPAPPARDGFRAPPDLSDIIGRLRGYMLKSVKEAKRHTSWLTPNEDYERAVDRFVERALSGPGGARFLPAFAPFAGRIARAGMVNSLAQVVLKIASPGVPDFYQGSELWDLSLVDPDNRRPVDFDLRQRMLDGIDELLTLDAPARAAAVAQLATGWGDGRIKMLVTALGLRLRRDWHDVFREGRYLPLVTDAAVAAGLVAFARLLDDRAVVVVAPRLVAGLMAEREGALPIGGDAWKTSRILLPPELKGRTFRHLLTGADIMPASAADDEWLFAGQVFEHLPVALLTPGLA